jgi:threonine dehydrogenase-like Zn-dependent dehydrogenase
MKAIQLTKPQEFNRVDIAEPKAPGPVEVMLKVHREANCGSDYGG